MREATPLEIECAKTLRARLAPWLSTRMKVQLRAIETSATPNFRDIEEKEVADMEAFCKAIRSLTDE